MVYGGGMRKWWGYVEVDVGTGTKFGEIWTENGRWMEVMLPGAGCPGLVAGCPGCRAGCPGSRSMDELDELRVERSNPGKIRGNCGWKLGKR